MKYAVTGHTYGIGQRLHERLGGLGFSKSTGHDITESKVRQEIIDSCKDVDVFINNAPADFGQSELLLELWEDWRDKDKTIINVGSRIAEIELTNEYSHLLKYQMHKQTLKKLSNTLAGLNTKCIVKYRWFAYVGTPKILAKYPDITDYISIDEAVDIILKEC
jgi:hypothetical protein